jgi:hypothetical protein
MSQFEMGCETLMMTEHGKMVGDYHAEWLTPIRTGFQCPEPGQNHESGHNLYYHSVNNNVATETFEIG